MLHKKNGMFLNPDLKILMLWTVVLIRQHIHECAYWDKISRKFKG